jgi:hypothetical protein
MKASVNCAFPNMTPAKRVAQFTQVAHDDLASLIAVTRQVDPEYQVDAMAALPSRASRG